MFGVFRMLALAVVVFCLRALRSDRVWERNQRLVRIGFWGLNLGLALMMLLDLFPAGVLQFHDAIAHGYWHARRLAFTMTGTFHALEWARAGGDLVFLLAGVVPLVCAAMRMIFARDTGQ
jgi:nitric oxide reductase subunit B